MKKFLCIVLAFLLCFSMTACAGSAESAASSDSAQKTIGIIAAMESEITAIKEAEDIVKTTTVAGLDFCEGTIGDCSVVVVECGVGKVNAALATQLLITEFGAEAIINVGCAGSLNDTLDIGDFVISEDVVQHDYDASAIGYEKGEILYTGKVSFEADADLIAVAEEAIAAVAPNRKVVTGRVCSGDQFISSDEQKAAILESFGGDCAEMEGAAVGQTAYLNGVPFVILRAMSDKANSAAGSSDFSQYQEQVSKEGAEVVLKMLELID